MRIELEPIAYVETVRTKVEDDYWGGEESCLTLSERFKPEALQGIEEFSHVEVIFFLDRIDSSKITMGARHPRDNPDWPKVGIFAQRGKNRPNRIGSTICRVVRRDGLRLYVAELDALDGTPVQLPFRGGRFEAELDETAIHILPVLLPVGSDRPAVMARMKQAGVQTSIHYPPVHGFASYAGGSDRLPHTTALAARELTLPFYPGLPDAHVGSVVETLLRSLEA